MKKKIDREVREVYQAFRVNISKISSSDRFRSSTEHNAIVTITKGVIDVVRRSNIVCIFTCDVKFIDRELESRGYIIGEDVIKRLKARSDDERV
jgi:broad-specificity NMP kinase